MAAQTIIEQVAAGCGYPSTLFGSTPSQSAYWHEPKLLWLTPLLHPEREGFDSDECAATIAGLRFATVEGSRMAPRFPSGAEVAMVPVGPSHVFGAGVYAWGVEGSETLTFARFFALSLDGRQLSCSFDIDGRAVVCHLDAPGLRLYYVSHYVSRPL